MKQPKFKVGDSVYNKKLDDFYFIYRVLACVDDEGNPTGFVYVIKGEDGLYTEEAFINTTFFKASVMPRYWEDAKVNGVEDTDGTLIPCRNGDEFEIIIDIKTGQIINWEKGKAANIHYKICDQGEYYILNDKKETVFHQAGYVPCVLSPDVERHDWPSSDYMVLSDSFYIEILTTQSDNENIEKSYCFCFDTKEERDARLSEIIEELNNKDKENE